MNSHIYDCPLISLDTEEDDLVSATVTEIWYKKPNSAETGKWTATVSGTHLRYQTALGEIDEKGTWVLQTHYVIGGYPFTGDKFLWNVKEIIEVE